MSTTTTSWGPLGPAVALMRQLNLPAKMGLIASLIAVPLAILTANSLNDAQNRLQVTRNEMAGAQTVARLLDVAVQTQTHRGQTNMSMSGNAAAETMLAETRPRLKQALAQVDTSLAAHPEWQLTPDWQRIRDPLARLADGQREGDRAAVFKAHTDQVSALRQLNSLLGERSELLFDPEAATFFLMDLSVERLLPATETAGLLRGHGAGLITKGSAEPADIATLYGRIAGLHEQIDMLRARVAALTRAGEAAPTGFDEMLQKAQAFEALARTQFAGGQPSGDAAAYFKAGTQAIEAMVGFSQATSARLATLLDQREARLSLQRKRGVRRRPGRAGGAAVLRRRFLSEPDGRHATCAGHRSCRCPG